MRTRRWLRNILVGILGLLLGMLIVALVALRTGMVDDFVRAEITRQLHERYAARAEMGALKLQVAPLTIEVKEVAVREEDAPATEPPVFRVARLLVGVQFLPLLRGRLELSQLLLDEPIARLHIDSRGSNNFSFASKQPAKTPSSGPSAVLDLEIENCVMHSGEFFYNDARIPLDAEIHDLKVAAAYSRLSGGYSGTLSYDRGRWEESGLAPIAHAAQMEFNASPSALAIRSLQLTSGSSIVHLTANISNYANPVIEATYRANLFTEDLAAILHQSGLPTGIVALDGTVNYRNSPQPFVAEVTVQGRLQSDGLSLTARQSGTQRGLQISTVSANYEIRDGNLRLDRLSGNILGGRLEASAEIEHLDADAPTVRLAAEVKGVSLATASDTFASSSLQRIPFVGTADIQGQAGWTGPFSSWSNNVAANGRLSLTAAEQTGDSRTIPVNGVVSVDYDARRNRISFGQSYLQTRATKLSASGTLDARAGGNSAITFNATTADLHEVSSLFAVIQNAVRPTASSATLPALGGSATLAATATGTARALRIQGNLTAQELSVGGSHWRSLRTDLSASATQISIRDASVLGDSHERIALNGEAGLKNWSPDPSSPLSVQAAASGITLAEVNEITHLDYPLTGTVSVNISLAGTMGAPEGKATAAVANGSAWNQPFSQLVLDGEFRQGAVHSTANLQTTAGSVSADAAYTIATQAYSLQLHGAGLRLEKLAALDSRYIVGTVDVSAMGEGTLTNPGLAANLTAPKIEVEGQSISNIAAQMNVAQQRANLSLHSLVDQGSVQVTADVDLTGNRYTTATLDVRALPIAAIAAHFVPAERSQLGGQTEIHLTLKGPLADPEKIQARLQIPSLAVTYGVAQLALSRPLEANYQNGVLTILNSQIQGTGTNLTFGGTLPIKNPAAFAIDANGTVDLDVVHRFVPAIQSKGELDIHVTSQGNANQPTMQGQVQVKNAAFSAQALPVSVAGLNGEIALSGNRAVIDTLSGTVGGGKVSATGVIDLGRATHFALAVNAQSVRIRYPQGLRSVVSAQINAEGTPSSSALTGRVTVDSLGFTQEFDLSKFAASVSGNSAGGPISPFEENMKLNVALVSAQDLDLASSKVSIGGAANLTLVGTIAEPVVLGRLALTSGDVFFLGKRFAVQSGTIEFANAARTEPLLNVYVTTTVEQYDVTLKLSGSVDRLRTSYTSVPTLSQADIIHLLAFGNTNAEAASGSTSSTETAESVLASGVTSPLAGKLQSLTGLSQLTLDPLSQNSQGDPGAVVGIQERVTGSLLFTYSTNVTDTQAETASIQYDLSKQLSLTLLRDQNGGYAIGVRLHKVF